MVCAGGVDIPYIRAGRGKAIVLLARDIDSLDVQHQIDILAHSFLVIAASPPPALDLASWLSDFLDGLGIVRTSILIDETIAELFISGESNHV